MTNKSLPELSPSQVVRLQDALLANADALLTSALKVLDLGYLALARSLAILGLEESGKAIAIHDRRIAMAFAEEGVGFTTKHLSQLWRSHTLKLDAVYDFLVEERYWFDVESPDPNVNTAALGAVQGWARRHNDDKQRGFYVDVRPDGEAHGPEDVDVDAASLREIIDRIHQIGWQLRLGEHIEWRGQQDLAAVVDGHSDTEGLRPRNVAYGFVPDGAEQLGQTGYEAMTREVEALRKDGGSSNFQEVDAQDG